MVDSRSFRGSCDKFLADGQSQAVDTDKALPFIGDADLPNMGRISKDSHPPKVSDLELDPARYTFGRQTVLFRSWLRHNYGSPFSRSHFTKPLPTNASRDSLGGLCGLRG